MKLKKVVYYSSLPYFSPAPMHKLVGEAIYKILFLKQFSFTKKVFIKLFF